MAYIKRFSGTPASEVANEVLLQRLAAEYGLTPDVLDTDNETYISMEDLEMMNIADVYGDRIEDIPDHINRDIWDILWALYACCNVEYIDVTPYNFIEKNGKVWVVDFGHARISKRGHINPWLLNVLNDAKMRLSGWNAEFA